MQKILFPTDFSDNAANALNYAIEVINHLKSVHLTIIHTYIVPNNVNTLVPIEGHIQQDSESEMNRVINQIQPLLAEGIVLQTMIKRADTVSTIGTIANDYDLVIMGTQGASGLKEIFLGSTTNGVIKHTQTPVLVVPNEYHFKPFENIVLSVDNGPINDDKGVQLIKRFLQIFKADLMLFHTEENAADKGFDRSVTKLFDNAGYSIDFNFIDKNVNESIEEMVIDYDVDLLCLIRRKRGFLENLFHQSVTSKEVFHAMIPLLILHDV